MFGSHLSRSQSSSVGILQEHGNCQCSGTYFSQRASGAEQRMKVDIPGDEKTLNMISKWKLEK